MKACQGGFLKVWEKFDFILPNIEKVIGIVISKNVCYNVITKKCGGSRANQSRGRQNEKFRGRARVRPFYMYGIHIEKILTRPKK